MSQTNDIRRTRIQSRVDTPENWEKENPILLEREIGYETNGKYKIGDGVTQWNRLSYATSGNLNLENGIGEDSLQQKLNTEYFQMYNNPEIAELIAKGEIIGEISEDGNRMNIKTGAFGNNSIAIGGRSQASGGKSYAEGDRTIALGDKSHAEGDGAIASGSCSHAEGNHTTASGNYSHSEGVETIASGNTSHAEGSFTTASGAVSHSEGASTTASGEYSHAEGYQTTASEYGSHAEGCRTLASGICSHAEGYYTTICELKINGLANTLIYSIVGELDIYAENFLNSFLKSNESNPNYRTIRCKYQSRLFNITNIDLNQKTLTLEKTLSNQDLNNEIIVIRFWTTASGEISHAEGGGTIADGSYSHAEGKQTTALGYSSHAEGKQTTASGNYSHAEGDFTTASGDVSHAEGYDTVVNSDYSHAEGHGTYAIDSRAFSEGKYIFYSFSGSVLTFMTTVADYDVKKIKAFRIGTHPTGDKQRIDIVRVTDIESSYSEEIESVVYTCKIDTPISELQLNSIEADKVTLQAIVEVSTLSVNGLHAEGEGSYAIGDVSHAEGRLTLAADEYTHSEGWGTVAYGRASHTEGYNTKTTANYSHAEGAHTEAGYQAHAEGADTKATGTYSHAQNRKTIASGEGSHAEGYMTEAKGKYSHAEGHGDSVNGYSIAEGIGSHIEGYFTKTTADYSHAEGYGTTATAKYQHVQGVCNIADSSCIHIVGNGNLNVPSNAHTLDWQGNAWFKGDIYTGGTKQSEGKKLATEKPYYESPLIEPGNFMITKVDNKTFYVLDIYQCRIQGGGPGLVSIDIPNNAYFIIDYIPDTSKSLAEQLLIKNDYLNTVAMGIANIKDNLLTIITETKPTTSFRLMIKEI